MASEHSVSHELAEETPEAKARWFRSLTMAERMQILCDFTDLALGLNPRIAEKNRAKPVPDVFESFHRLDVKYVVIGGIAAILHGVPRATFDVDILIEATPENARRLLEALLAAGFGTASLTTPEEVLESEITVFKDRVRLDVQTRTPGIRFEDVWSRRQTVAYQNQEFHILSKADLIRSKRAAGRPVDLQDVRLLESMGEPAPSGP